MILRKFCVSGNSHGYNRSPAVFYSLTCPGKNRNCTHRISWRGCTGARRSRISRIGRRTSRTTDRSPHPPACGRRWDQGGASPSGIRDLDELIMVEIGNRRLKVPTCNCMTKIGPGPRDSVWSQDPWNVSLLRRLSGLDSWAGKSAFRFVF